MKPFSLSLPWSSTKSTLGYTPTSPATKGRITNILGLRHLETMPAQAARAFQLASDPNATSADFVKIIEADEVLSARVVRIANSVYFFRGSPAHDIEKAVANIGLNELRCLLSASMLRSLLQGKGKAREQVWANSVATALCCRNFSSFAQLNEGEAFLSGLVHDLGKIIIIRHTGSLYDKVIEHTSSGQINFVDAEEKILELNHVEVGKWVAEHWNFPHEVVEAIANHHDSWGKEPKKKGNILLSHLVKVADTCAHAMGAGHPSSFQGFSKRAQEELPLAFSQLGLSSEEGLRFIKDLKGQFEKEFELYQGDG